METPLSKLPKPNYTPPKKIKIIAQEKSAKTWKYLDLTIPHDFKEKYFNRK